MKESLLIAERVMDAEGTLIGSGSVMFPQAERDQWIEKLAQTATPDIVALNVRISGEQRAKNEEFVWIDGKIVPGEKLKHTFSDPNKSPQLSEHVVIAKTGTIFTAHANDSVISSKPK